MQSALPVNELFETLQGEATFTGTPAVFIRLQGCDVGCPWCPTPDALALLPDMTTAPFGALRPGMQLLGTARKPHEAVGLYREATILDVVPQIAKRVRVIFDDGRESLVTPYHRFVRHDSRGRFIRADRLRAGHVLRRYDVEPHNDLTALFKQGWLAGAADGDGCFWTIRGRYRRFRLACNDLTLLQRFHAWAQELGFSVRWGTHRTRGLLMDAAWLTEHEQAARLEQMVLADQSDAAWWWGYLGGMYDTDGTTSGGEVLRITQQKTRQRERIKRALARVGVAYIEEDRGVRIVGGASVHRTFIAKARPALTRKTDPFVKREHRHSGMATVARVEPAGRGDIVSVMTDLGTYIADGLPARNCDTKHTWAPPTQVQQIPTFEMVNKTEDAASIAWIGTAGLVRLLCHRFHARHVVFTGGEPAIYDLEPVSRMLLDKHWTVQLETSGTYPIRIDPRAWVTVSPKIDMPGGREVLQEALERANEIKMPVGKPAHAEQVRQLVGTLKPPGGIWLQPLSTSEKATKVCVEEATRRGWRVSVQTHKFAGLR